MISFIFFILVFAIFLCFIIFNLGNTCDVSLGFKTFHDIPVFVTALFSYALGMLFVLPLIFTVGRKRKLKAARVQVENSQTEGGDSRVDNSKVPPPKKKFFGFISSKKPDLTSEEDKIKKENSPYGID